jgi:hypothetical protein
VKNLTGWCYSREAAKVFLLTFSSEEVRRKKEVSKKAGALN